MNTKLFATAALIAAAVSAPAFAQNIGSVGAAVNYADVNTRAGGANGTSAVLDGSVAIPLSGAWTVTANGDVSISDNDLSDETVASGAVHLTTKLGDTVRVGGFTALSRPSNDTLWAVGESPEVPEQRHADGPGRLRPVERPGRRPVHRPRRSPLLRVG